MAILEHDQVDPHGDPERIVRAVSHGLANRLLAIRCYAELAALADADDVREELDSLLRVTDETAALVRQLASTVREAVSKNGDGMAALAPCIARLFPDETLLDGGTAR
jgi:signal transduction histidine kinase